MQHLLVEEHMFSVENEKDKTGKTTMENLPDGILSDIFIRLLAKQLAQMRCVCKPWNVLLSESSFVKSHLHRSIHHNDEILLFFPFFFPDCSSITPRLSCFPDLKLTNFIKPPLDNHPPYNKSYGHFIGAVNGLICFYYKLLYDGEGEYILHIWNPSLSAMLALPPCSLPSHGLKNTHFRFGFDPKTDDYKVVKLTSTFNPLGMLPQAEVYSMRKGSWKLISQSFPSHVYDAIDQDKVCVDGLVGHLHWLGYLGITELEWKPLYTIVAFDLGAETFREIPLPDYVLHHESKFNKLGVMDGKLCMMSRGGEGGKWEVWVMDEYGVAESWVKHHVFSQFSANIIPYGFTSHNKFLFKVNRDDERFSLYDPVAASAITFEIMPIHNSGHKNLGCVHKIVEYVDSFVWVAPAAASPDFSFEEASQWDGE